MTRYANNFLAGNRSYSQYNTFMEMFHVKQSLKAYDSGRIGGCLHTYKLLYIQSNAVEFPLHSHFELIGNCKLIEMPGNHDIHRFHPDVFIDAVNKLL